MKTGFCKKLKSNLIDNCFKYSLIDMVSVTIVDTLVIKNILFCQLALVFNHFPSSRSGIIDEAHFRGKLFETEASNAEINAQKCILTFG